MRLIQVIQCTCAVCFWSVCADGKCCVRTPPVLILFTDHGVEEISAFDDGVNQPFFQASIANVLEIPNGGFLLQLFAESNLGLGRTIAHQVWRFNAAGQLKATHDLVFSLVGLALRSGEPGIAQINQHNEVNWIAMNGVTQTTLTTIAQPVLTACTQATDTDTLQFNTLNNTNQPWLSTWLHTQQSIGIPTGILYHSKPPLNNESVGGHTTVGTFW